MGGGAFGEIYRGKLPIRSLLLSFIKYWVIQIVEKRKTGEVLAAKVVSHFIPILKKTIGKSCQALETHYALLGKQAYS